ncbi:hypothetical protein N9E86_02185, partial [Alphaproteobacteria bacterium]|nr:hypothetical protein [Alphaproteobacteria bacterium]
MRKEEVTQDWSNNRQLTLDRALKAGVPAQKCFVYKLSVGGSDYIGFTTQNPKKRLEQHLESAENESKQKVHLQLRRFGYLHDFEVISEHENEVLALVAEIINIKKHGPELNTSIGGEGHNFDVVEGKNHLGENVFFVWNKNVKSDVESQETENEIEVTKYIKLIEDCYSEYLNKERLLVDEITSADKLHGNTNSTRYYAWSYFFYDMGTSFDCHPTSTREPHPDIINEIHEYFYDYERNVEIQFDKTEVASKVSSKIEIRKEQHKKFVKWLNSNKGLLLFLYRHHISLLFPGSHTDFSNHRFKKTDFPDVNRIFVLETGNEDWWKKGGPDYKSVSVAKTKIMSSDWFREAKESNLFQPGDALYPINVKGFFSQSEEWVM